MRLNLNENGMIPNSYPQTFWRVEQWGRGYYIADFDNEAEAVRFAIEDSGKGNIDHAVRKMTLTRA